jgi:hypothetical protein
MSQPAANNEANDAHNQADPQSRREIDFRRLEVPQSERCIQLPHDESSAVLVFFPGILSETTRSECETHHTSATFRSARHATRITVRAFATVLRETI